MTIPKFEEMVEQMSKVDRSYRVSNVTFCSDRSMYPESPQHADFYFNHLEFKGDVYVLKGGTMVASMKHRPRISGREAYNYQVALFGKYLNAEAISSSIDTLPYEFYVGLKKAMGEFTTYGHEEGSNKLTFVFDQPNPQTGEVSLYKIHTRKFKPYSEVREKGRIHIPRCEPDPISPLEIIE